MTPTGKRAFTLLELSIVLIIIALITGVSMQMGISMVASARLVATQKKMKLIQEALFAFRAANDRLPCPADLTLAQDAVNVGVEGATPGTCTGSVPAANFSSIGAAEGALPVVTLKLPADLMYDGWGNRFRYAVDTAMTATGAFSSTPLGANCGPITVNDANGNARSKKAMYTLVSHGSNGHGGYTNGGVPIGAASVNARELTNCHCNSAGAATAYSPTYVQMTSTQDSANGLNNFDDLVTYQERWQLRTDWDKAGGQCTYVYITDYSNDRIEMFTGSGSYRGQFGTHGTGNGQFCGSWGIGINQSTGHVYVSDYDSCLSNNWHRVEEFDAQGTFVATFAQHVWRNPADITVNQATGDIYIVDSDNHRIQVWDKNYNLVRYIGSPGTGNGQFMRPYGVAVDSFGNVWVLDTYNHRVQEFTSAGVYIKQFGSYGSGDNQFNLPWGMAFDPSGYLWVADTYNDRILKLDANGNLILKIAAQYSSPEGIAVDTDGNVYAVFWWGYYVRKYNGSTGALITQFGTSGSGNGQFTHPYRIAISR